MYKRKTMLRHVYLAIVICLVASPPNCFVTGGGAPGDTVVISGGGRYIHSSHGQSPSSQSHSSAGSGHLEHRNSYTMLSEAMSQAVSHEFSSLGSGSADGSCSADDLECYNVQDRLGMEAIRSLHRQLDDDDNGNIDLSESDDFLREELKYDSGYEKRQKAFHYNDDMHISVKELWESWLRSEVHNWTSEQTTDWLAQSVQLPQYVDLFKQHKVTGATLPRLAVNNMHYVSNVLGIKDPIHKQKIALKAMDVVLFGPPRETGTRWKDYILVTLLLSAIIGCWYAYQQNKNAKKHLRRMAKDMEGLQKAEQALQEMQKELERARMEQENVATEKLDLERRLKEAPSLSSSSSDLELQQLKQEIEMLRSELSRAEVELVDHCWSPPPQLQSWLQYTYELESKNHMKKRMMAEKQLQQAREACEKLRRKRSSLVGAFVSTHGKSIDDVDRSIVEARNSLSEVTNELQERLHRWKQIEMLLGFSIVNNNGLAYLENILYSRNGSSSKSSRGRITNSTDDLDDDSVQGMIDNYGRNSATSGGFRDDSSASDDGDNQSVQFYLGTAPTPSVQQQQQQQPMYPAPSVTNVNSISTNTPGFNSHPVFNSSSDSSSHNIVDESRHSPSVSSERSVTVPPRTKKPAPLPSIPAPPVGPIGRAPLPPPRRTNQSNIVRSPSTDTVPMEFIPYHPITTSSHFQSTASIVVSTSSSAAAAATTTTPTTISGMQSSISPSGGAFTGVLPTIHSGTPTTPTNQPISTQISGIGISTISTPQQSATITSTTYCDPQIEDTNSTDSSSFDGEFKKRRRKLHFPFGKKSNKNKLA